MTGIENARGLDRPNLTKEGGTVVPTFHQLLEDIAGPHPQGGCEIEKRVMAAVKDAIDQAHPMPPSLT